MKNKETQVEMTQIEMEFKKTEHQTAFFLQQHTESNENNFNEPKARIVTTVTSYSTTQKRQKK